MKKLLVLVLVLMSLCVFTSANASEINPDDIYSEQYNASGADSLSDALPDNVADSLDKLDISGTDISWTEYFTPKNIFSHIFDFFKSGGKRPLTAGLSVLAVMLFSTAVKALNDKNKTVDYVLSIGVTVAVVLPAVSSIKACVSVIETACVFMLALIPVYASVLVSGGKPLTASGFSAVMLSVSNAVSSLCSFVIVPLTGIQLALSVSSSVSPDIKTESLSKGIKRASLWIMSLSTTVLLGILGIQTVVSGSADSVSSKMAKFLLGTAVPVVGSTVSEALATVKGCVKLLGSSVAVYAIVALCCLVLPIIIELLLWRVSMLFCASFAETLSQDKCASLLRAVDSAISFVLGVVILVGMLFIISVTMVAVF